MTNDTKPEPDQATVDALVNTSRQADDGPSDLVRRVWAAALTQARAVPAAPDAERCEQWASANGFGKSQPGTWVRDAWRAGWAAAIAAAPSPADQPEAQVSKAAADVLAERRRQVEVEGWTPEHDDEHYMGEMAQAAAAYVVGNQRLWPPQWDRSWWKPKDRRSNLIRAAALLLAEIERLDRAADQPPPAEKPARPEGERGCELE